MPFFIHRSDEFLNSLFDFSGDGKITVNEMFPLYKAVQASIRDGVKSVEPEPEEEEDDWDYESDDDEPFFY